MKKLLLAGAIILFCDPTIYDSIYRAIILDIMKHPVTRPYLEDRNRAITTLRKLCRGQRSSYETH